MCKVVIALDMLCLVPYLGDLFCLQFARERFYKIAVHECEAVQRLPVVGKTRHPGLGGFDLQPFLINAGQQTISKKKWLTALQVRVN